MLGRVAAHETIDGMSMAIGNQQSLFDPDDAENRKRKGMAKAVAHSGPDWQEYAVDYVRVYLIRHPELFCDDVWTSGLVIPDSPRAFGQVMKEAIRRGWMENSGQARKSTQSNNSLRAVYRSLIYNPVPQARPPYPTFES